MSEFVHPPEPEILSNKEAGARQLALQNASKVKEKSESESDSETDESDSDNPAQSGAQISMVVEAIREFESKHAVRMTAQRSGSHVHATIERPKTSIGGMEKGTAPQTEEGK